MRGIAAQSQRNPCSISPVWLRNFGGVRTNLFRKLDNYVFQGRPLKSILTKYSTENEIEADSDGKTLYGIIINELRSIKKDRDELVEIIVKYLMETNQPVIDALSEYLSKKIAEV